MFCADESENERFILVDAAGSARVEERERVAGDREPGVEVEVWEFEVVWRGRGRLCEDARGSWSRAFSSMLT